MLNNILINHSYLVLVTTSITKKNACRIGKHVREKTLEIVKLEQQTACVMIQGQNWSRVGTLSVQTPVILVIRSRCIPD